MYVIYELVMCVYVLHVCDYGDVPLPIEGNCQEWVVSFCLTESYVCFILFLFCFVLSWFQLLCVFWANGPWNFRAILPPISL